MELLVKRNGWHHLRPFGRRLLGWRYRLFQTHRHNRLVLEDGAGLGFLFFERKFELGNRVIELLG